MIRNRREVLKSLGAGGALMQLPSGFRQAWAAAEPDVELNLTAAPDAVALWPGAKTSALPLTAKVLRGRRDAVRPSAQLPDTYLGPVLDLRRGERVRIRFVNRTGEPSVVHWHGMLVPEQADGHPRFAIGSGREYVYDFEVRNPAGTYLYHPHPHDQQAGAGMCPAARFTERGRYCPTTLARPGRAPGR